MLPRNLRQEALCRAYVRAVAARSGVICGGIENDLGFDLFLRSVESHDQQFWDGGAQLDIQLKSTTRAEVRETSVVYDLDARAYNILRQANTNRPRILVLLVLPEAESEWLSQTEDALLLRRCAYWISLRGAEPSTAQTTVRITVRRANVFSVDSLQALLVRAREGELL
jgi:Domain of unknown function (DUF4365)